MCIFNRGPNIEPGNMGRFPLENHHCSFAFLSVAEHESHLGRPIGKALVDLNTNRITANGWESQESEGLVTKVNLTIRSELVTPLVI